MIKQSFILFIFLFNFQLLGRVPESDSLWSLKLPVENLPGAIQINSEYLSSANFIQRLVFYQNERKPQLEVNVGTVKTSLGVELFAIDISEEEISIDSMLTFSWRWMIKDTEISDGILIIFEIDQTDFTLIGSHSNYTFPHTLMCEEKSCVWATHKVNVFNLFNEALLRERFYNKQICKLKFFTMQSIDQELWLENLTFTREPAIQSEEVENFQFKNNHADRIWKLKPASVCLSDVDRDGDLDMFLVNQAGSNYLMKNDGLGRFTGRKILTPNQFWHKNSHAIFTDLDGDGWSDLFEARENNENVFFFNKGNDKFQYCKKYSDGSEDLTQTYNSLWGNFDSDPVLDFFEITPAISKSNMAFKKIRLNLNQYNSIKLLGWPSALFGSAAADINKDNQLEIFVADSRNENILFNYDGQTGLRKISDKIYKDKRQNNKPIDDGFSASEGAVFFDFDHDGDMDIYVGNDGEPNQLYAWDSNKFIESAAKYNLNDSLESEGFLIADFDNDSDWDIYILHSLQSHSLLKNDGNGYFTDVTSGSGFEHPGGSTGAACGDIDNDGDVDIVVVDPVKGYHLLINPTNNNHFVKIKMRGEPYNYYGIRSKISIYEAFPDTSVLRCYHQTTCGDGFQYEAMARDFHFGADPDADYKIRVVFSDGKESIIKKTRAGSTVLALHPGSNGLIQVWQHWLYKVHEPVLEWLRRHNVLIAYLAIVLIGILFNFYKSRFINRVSLKFTSGVLGSLTIYLFFRDLETIHEVSLAALSILSVFFTESFINTLRLYLHKHYVKEHSWDRLYDHLKAFRHGGMALKNMDRLVFLLQNYTDYSGDRIQYHQHVADAMTTYLNQTSWQIGELKYILSNLHWRARKTTELALLNRQLVKRFNKVLQKESGQNWDESAIDFVINKIKHIQSIIENIYQKISGHFSSNPAEIIRQVLKTKFHGHTIEFTNESGSKGKVIIKGYELGNIIADLIQNGKRACDDLSAYQGTIRLSEEDNYILIDVSDNGCGMPKSIRDKIFEKGFSRKDDGGGFGLFYSREVLARYGGDIQILSTAKNQGTTMRIKLKKVKTE